MEENVIQINIGMIINIDVSVKNAMYVKKIMFEILPHVVVKMKNIQQVLSMIQLLHAMKLLNHMIKTRKLSCKTTQKLF